MHVGRERGDYYTFFCSSENVFQRLPYYALGSGKARACGIGAVAKHQFNAQIADFSQFPQVDGISVHRCVIYLEISRMEDDSLWGPDGHTDAVRYAVGGPYGFHLKVSSHHETLTCIDGPEICHDLVLLKFVPYESDGEPGAVYRHLHISQKIWYGADMVLMTVGDHQAFDLLSVGYQVTEIRNYHVDPEHLVIGEAHPAVDDHYLIVVFQEGHVLSYLVETSYGNDLKGRLRMVIL